MKNLLPENITAHNGFEGTTPNSPSGYLRALELGADILECDIHLIDGCLRISHDAIETDPNDFSLLSEVFELMTVHPGASLQCDCKSFNIPLEIMELAKQYGIPREKLVITGNLSLDFVEKHLDRIHEGCTLYMGPEHLFDHPRFLLRRYIEPVAKIAKERNIILNICHSYVEPEDIMAFNDLGVRSSIWTINEPSNADRFMTCGLLNMTARNAVSYALKRRKELSE